MTFAQIKSHAFALSHAQRAKLFHALVQSLEDPDEKPITIEELDRRAADLDSGRVKGIPAEEVIACARRRLSRQR